LAHSTGRAGQEFKADAESGVLIGNGMKGVSVGEQSTDTPFFEILFNGWRAGGFLV
jgi:hypothetical protein